PVLSYGRPPMSRSRLPWVILQALVAGAMTTLLVQVAAGGVTAGITDYDMDGRYYSMRPLRRALWPMLLGLASSFALGSSILLLRRSAWVALAVTAAGVLLLGVAIPFANALA